MTRRPSALESFFHAVEDMDACITDWTSMTRAECSHCWVVTVTDPDPTWVAVRYGKHARRADMEIYSLVSQPLKHGGVSIALIIGIPQEAHHV